MTNSSPGWVCVAILGELRDDEPAAASADGVDLVVVKSAGRIYVLYGRCPHRGALMAHGCVEAGALVCTAHGWDFSLESGESTRVRGESLSRFTVRVDAATGQVLINSAELESWRADNPQAFAPGEFF